MAKAAKKPAGKKKPKISTAEIQNAKYKELVERIGASKPQPYRMASVYTQDAVIEHPKFGIGFVLASFPDKIEVVFEDVNRNLVQGRK